MFFGGVKVVVVVGIEAITTYRQHRVGRRNCLRIILGVEVKLGQVGRSGPFAHPAQVGLLGRQIGLGQQEVSFNIFPELSIRQIVGDVVLGDGARRFVDPGNAVVHLLQVEVIVAAQQVQLAQAHGALGRAYAGKAVDGLNGAVGPGDALVAGAPLALYVDDVGIGEENLQQVHAVLVAHPAAAFVGIVRHHIAERPVGAGRVEGVVGVVDLPAQRRVGGHHQGFYGGQVVQIRRREAGFGLLVEKVFFAADERNRQRQQNIFIFHDANKQEG